jgi:hypothetical protein
MKFQESLLCFFLFIPILASCQGAQLAAVAEFNFLVLDSEGYTPIYGANIGTRSILPSEVQEMSTVTDKNGRAAAKMPVCHDAEIVIEGDGYYPSTYNYHLRDFGRAEEGKWIFDERQFVIHLKKRGVAQAMYAYRVDERVPVVGEAVGYDLQVHDWVSPHGTGEVSDFSIMANARVNSFHDRECSLEITFSGKYDGIQSFIVPVVRSTPQGSQLRSNKIAPSTQYSPKYESLFRVNHRLEERVNSVRRLEPGPLWIRRSRCCAPIGVSTAVGPS